MLRLYCTLKKETLVDFRLEEIENSEKEYKLELDYAAFYESKAGTQATLTNFKMHPFKLTKEECENLQIVMLPYLILLEYGIELYINYEFVFAINKDIIDRYRILFDNISKGGKIDDYFSFKPI